MFACITVVKRSVQEKRREAGGKVDGPAFALEGFLGTSNVDTQGVLANVDKAGVLANVDKAGVLANVDEAGVLANVDMLACIED